MRNARGKKKTREGEIKGVKMHMCERQRQKLYMRQASISEEV